MMIGYFDITPIDQDLSKNPPKAATRSEPAVDPELRKLAAAALGSKEAFDAFAAAVKKAYPRVDRVDVTGVYNDKLRVVQSSYPGEGLPKFAEAGFEAPVRACALSGVALLNMYQVIPALEKAQGMDLNMINKKGGLNSSLHAPVALDGSPASVNFWSKDANAFSKDKDAGLRVLAKAVANRK
jgi:hypothetical protein